MLTCPASVTGGITLNHDTKGVGQLVLVRGICSQPLHPGNGLLQVFQHAQQLTEDPAKRVLLNAASASPLLVLSVCTGRMYLSNDQHSSTNNTH